MRPFAIFGLAIVLAAAGCVSSETFRKKEAEANELREARDTEAARRSILEEQLRQQQAQADAELAVLRGQVGSDEANLAQKESELRAMRQQLVEQQALVDELSRSKKRLETAKAELEKKSGDYAQLATALRAEIESGRVELMELRGRTTVKMKDKILFSSGSATIGGDGREALRKVADALRSLQGKLIRVEGHTDNVPTGHGGPFATNWELSSARALAVVRFLQEGGVDPTRLSGAGFGEYQPVAPNDSPEGRSQNRRIEIVLVPLEGAPTAPAARPARM